MQRTDLTLRLAQVARELATETDPTQLLQRAVHAARREVPGADSAGVTRVSRDGATTDAATDDLVTRVDAAQYAAGEGPCIAAAESDVIDGVVLSNDLNLDDRWPTFAPAAVAEGVRSMLSMRLSAEAGTVAALNLYAAVPNAFDADSHVALEAVVAHISVAVASTRHRAGLVTALESRDVIGQAKGILMERYKVDAVRAFDMLIAVSQQNNTKLRVVAERLSTTGVLPDRRP